MLQCCGINVVLKHLQQREAMACQHSICAAACIQLHVSNCMYPIACIQLHSCNAYAVRRFLGFATAAAHYFKKVTTDSRVTACNICCVDRRCINWAVHAHNVLICARLGCYLTATWPVPAPSLAVSYGSTHAALKLCSWLVVCPPAGRPFNTLSGDHHQQQRDTPPETSPHAFSEGSQGQAQAGTEEQQVADAGGQQLHSTDRDEEGVPREVGYSQRGTYHRPSQPAAVEQQFTEEGFMQGQGLHQAPQAEANAEAEEDDKADRAAEKEADKSAAEIEVALGVAQEAQQQAVRAGQEALAEERQSLMQMRSDLQQASGQSQQTVCGSHCPCNGTFVLFVPLPNHHMLADHQKLHGQSA